MRKVTNVRTDRAENAPEWPYGVARAGLAASPGLSLLPRNNLRMTFDPPERKAEGEPGPFSHVIATRILREGDMFLRESSVEAWNRNAGYAIGSRIAEWQEGKKSAEDARARRVERTS